MKKISVYCEGWGERWLLGTLAYDGQRLLCEYFSEALHRGLELSPRNLALRALAYGDFPAHQMRLPGLVADALPDGWGLLLMDLPAEDVQLLELAQQALVIIADRDSDALRALAVMGGSPHGAHPKVLVHYNPASGYMSTTPFEGSAAWLVKLQAQDEHKEVCAIEVLYAELAGAFGLDMPATRYFNMDKKLAGFGIERFDVKDGMRVPVHTLAGFMHANFRLPSSVDYLTFLRATRFNTRSQVEVDKAFERAVFNVVFNNRDDHAKSLSYRMERDCAWRLAPGYDLTYCEGPGGEHQMDVCGEGRNITRANIKARHDTQRLQACSLTWSSHLETARRRRAPRQTARAHCDGAPVHYARHRPEQTRLYRLVQQHGATSTLICIARCWTACTGAVPTARWSSSKPPRRATWRCRRCCTGSSPD